MSTVVEVNYNTYHVFDETTKIGIVTRKRFGKYGGLWQYKDLNDKLIDQDQYRFDLFERNNIYYL